MQPEAVSFQSAFEVVVNEKCRCVGGGGGQTSGGSGEVFRV